MATHSRYRPSRDKDNVNDEKYWTNRNPNTNIGMNNSNWPLHGYDYTITAQTHLTNREILNIEDVEPVEDAIKKHFGVEE